MSRLSPSAPSDHDTPGGRPLGSGPVPVRARRAVRVVAWAYVITGVGHLSSAAYEATWTPGAAGQRALDAMAAASVPMPPTHRLLDLYWGYSLLMGLMVLATGALVLLVSRHIDRTPDLLRPLLVLIAVISAVGLVLSVLLMPAPPIITLSVALIAAGTGLTAKR